ncbi:hypothetical protein BC829DRAFT_404257, partial [Chytridium lagenaria]
FFFLSAHDIAANPPPTPRFLVSAFRKPLFKIHPSRIKRRIIVIPPFLIRENASNIRATR